MLSGMNIYTQSGASKVVAYTPHTHISTANIDGVVVPMQYAVYCEAIVSKSAM
jgi:hypothetical protein